MARRPRGNASHQHGAAVDDDALPRGETLAHQKYIGLRRAVARLDGWLGIRLFARNALATNLTEAGQRLLGQVSPLLASIGEAA